jgi:D-alanyl-D-alanine carboxypeptidase
MTDSQRRRTVGRRRRVGWAHLNAIAIGAVVVAAAALFVVVIGAIARDGSNNPPAGVITPGGGQTVPGGQTTDPSETPGTQTPTPSIDQPETVACGDILVPLDKTHRLTADCVPGDLRDLPAAISYGGAQRLRSEAAGAFEDLVAAAESDGVTLLAVSAYRGYDDQVRAYEDNRVVYGDEVDRFSARPGHSEHQLGTTLDVSSATAAYSLEGFEGTPEAAWVASNSWRFGFIVSYPEGKEEITGYAYEPWHIRYVGKETAAAVRESGLTLHEYLLQ